MNKLSKLMLAGAALVALTVGAAWAGGDWPGVPIAGGGGAWKTSTVYAQGAFVQANGNTYQMATNGPGGQTCTSASSGSGPSGYGGVANNVVGVADGTCVWQYVSPAYSTLPLTGNETIPADTQLSQGQAPQTELITTQQLGNYTTGQATRNNALIGGDATTNLWQVGTAGTSTTSATVAWDSADRWGQWTLSSAGVKIARDSTAADLPTSYQYAFALTHTTTTAGQICMGQWVESVNSYQFAGQTAELDFHAATGAGYTGGATLTAYIVYGTGTDEGLNKMAYTVNAGGATGWTSGVNATAAVIPLSAVSTIGRFAAVAAIPSTATEIGVAFCYTASTTDTNDYVAFSGIQLVRNAALTSYASATVGYVSTAIPLTAFERRPQGQESILIYRYTYSIKDAVAGAVYATGQCYDTTSNCVFFVKFPVKMRATPTAVASAATAFAYTATAGGAHDCTNSDFTVVASSDTLDGGAVECSAGAVNIAGGATQLLGKATPSSATVVWTNEL